MLVARLRPVLALVLAVASMAGLSAEQPAAAAATGAVLTVVSTRFEATRPGATYGGNINLRNTGDATATARAVRFSGPDRTAFTLHHKPLAWDLDQAAQGRLNIDFHPTTLGWKEAYVSIEYYIGVGNESDSIHYLDLTLRALATSNPKGVVAKTQHLGPVQQGDWDSGTVTLTNTAEGRVTIGEIVGTSGEVEEEVLADRCIGVSLAHGDRCRIDYRLRSDTIGSEEAGLLVKPAAPYVQQSVELFLDVTPNPAYPDDLRPHMVRVDQPVPVALDFTGSTPRMTLRLSWLGNDERRIGGYRLDVSPGLADDWTTLIDQQPPFPEPPQPTTSTRYDLGPGVLGTRVQARDMAGNESGWMSEVTEYRFHDITASTATAKGSWTASGAAGISYGGTVLRGSGAGASVTMRVTGRMLALVGRKSATSGKIQIWIDGKKRRTVDLHASTTQDARVLATFPDEVNVRHTVKVVVIEGGGRTKATLDAWLSGG